MRTVRSVPRLVRRVELREPPSRHLDAEVARQREERRASALGVCPHQQHRVRAARALAACARPQVGAEQERRRRLVQDQPALLVERTGRAGRSRRRPRARARRSSRPPTRRPRAGGRARRSRSGDPNHAASAGRRVRAGPVSGGGVRCGEASPRRGSAADPALDTAAAIHAVRLVSTGHRGGYRSHGPVSANRVIGVDLGGTKIAAGIVDRDGGSARARSSPRRPPPRRTSSRRSSTPSRGCSRPVGRSASACRRPSTRRGVAVSSVNIPFADVPLRQRIGDRFGVPCGIDNDANAAAIAEWQVGAGRGTRHMIMLTLGTGVGGGLILDGKPYRGAVGAAAARAPRDRARRPPLPGLVHGPRPSRGVRDRRRGDEGRRGGVRRRRRHEARARACARGDEHALELLDGIGRRLGSALGSLVNIFDPEAIVIGGVGVRPRTSSCSVRPAR